MRNLVAAVLLLLMPAMIFCQDKEEMAQPLKEAKREHEAAILAMPDVVSVGIGKDSKGKLAIIIGLERSNAKTEAKIRQLLTAHPVEVRVIGKVKAQ
jgi:hypothetical protein